MAKPTSREFERALRAHRDVLDRILDRRSVVALKRLYDRAQDELEKKLTALVRVGRHETMTAAQVQQLLMQVRQGQQAIAAQMHKTFVPITREAQLEGIQQVDRSIVTLERAYTGTTITLPLSEAATFTGIIDKRASSLIRANAASFQRYGSRVTAAIEEQLALSLATGETPLDAIERVRSTADLEWWQGERIVRTELAHAFNSAHADSIEVAAKDLRGLGKRWSEHVDDATGAPLDNRVAADSMVLHGQVAAQDGVFVMPPDNRVSSKMWNKTYRNGPNRPNDRSVTMPWRPHYPVPSWEWKGGQKVPMAQDTRTLEDLRAEARRFLAT